MAGVFEVSCNECAYQKRFTSPVLFMTWKGNEHVIPHPGEYRTIQEITGLDAGKAKEFGATFIGKEFMICLQCGVGACYTSKSADCEKCGMTALSLPQNKYPGCVAGIFGIGRRQEYTESCPECRNGIITMRIIGRS